MTKPIHIGFFVSSLAAAIILGSLPLDDMKFAFHKLGPALQSDIRFRDQIALSCGTLNLANTTAVESFVLEHLPIPARTEPGTDCTLLAKAAHATRYRLRSTWDFKIQIRNPDGMPVADRHFTVDFPRPLVLFPLVLFLLALVFEFPWWGLKTTAASYIFLLCGANLANVFRAVGQGLYGAFTDDQSWAGLFLILFWVAMVQAARPTKKTIFPKPTTRDRWFNRLFLGTIGLWNPAAFTLCGRLLLPFEGALTRISPFLMVQVTAFTLSLYLLALDFNNLRVFLGDSLLLPRYFTFSILLFLLLATRGPRREPIAWQMPGFWRSVAFVVAIEVLAFQSSWLHQTSTLVRIGLALVASQLVWPMAIQWARVRANVLRWGMPLLMAASITAMSTQQSANDLALLIFDPRLHPTAMVFFTYTAGIGLGFITGNFGVAFFALFTTLMKFASNPLIKAALLDGILAGILLSPFSLLNLIPAAQFRLGMSALIAERFRQLTFPLLIGTTIYAIGAINSVAILRPATFVFLCLVAVAVQLKKGAWNFGSYTISLDSRNGAH